MSGYIFSILSLRLKVIFIRIQLRLGVLSIILGYRRSMTADDNKIGNHIASYIPDTGTVTAEFRIHMTIIVVTKSTAIPK